MKLNRFVIVLMCLTGSASFGQQPDNAPTSMGLSPERRAADLVSRMTLEEKVLQMQSTAPVASSLLAACVVCYPVLPVLFTVLSSGVRAAL